MNGDVYISYVIRSCNCCKVLRIRTTVRRINICRERDDGDAALIVNLQILARSFRRGRVNI